MSAIQVVKSEYSNRHSTLDLLIERYETLRERAEKLYAAWSEDPWYTFGDQGARAPHPNLKSYIELERLLHATAKELGFVARMLDIQVDDDDDVETFLENIQQQNRPHRLVNRNG